MRARAHRVGAFSSANLEVHLPDQLRGQDSPENAPAGTKRHILRCTKMSSLILQCNMASASGHHLTFSQSPSPSVDLSANVPKRGNGTAPKKPEKFRKPPFLTRPI